MPLYRVTFTLTGSATYEVEAPNKQAAVALIEDEGEGEMVSEKMHHASVFDIEKVAKRKKGKR